MSIMKRISILGLIIVLLGVIYLIADKQLFYYGKNDLKIYKSLPLDIRPESRNDFEGGFILRNREGFAIAGKGVSVGKIGDTAFQYDIIDKVLKYGFNKENVVVLIKDTARRKYYVEYLRDNTTMSKAYIKVKDISTELDFSVNKWVDIQNGSHMKFMELCRNYSLFIAIILLFILLYSILKRKFFQSYKKTRLKSPRYP